MRAPGALEKKKFFDTAIEIRSPNKIVYSTSTCHRGFSRWYCTHTCLPLPRGPPSHTGTVTQFRRNSCPLENVNQQYRRQARFSHLFLRERPSWGWQRRNYLA